MQRFATITVESELVRKPWQLDLL